LQSRNPGLDLFRTLAISFVLISHSRHLFTYLKTDYFNWWWLSVGGYLGVELFFVLSGILIGDILIKKVLGSKALFYNLKVFFIRRWLRTLPLYYLLLGIFTIDFFLWHNKVYIPYLHIFFLQNFDKSAIKFFPVSWSLSVEEWFYLLIPFFILAGFFYFRKIFATLLAFFLLISLFKAYYVFVYPELTWTDIRKNIFLRFDSLTVGVMVAYLKNYRYKLFKKLSDKSLAFAALFSLVMLIAWYYYKEQPGLDRDYFSKAFMFQLTSLVLMPLMLYLYFNISKNYRFFYYGSLYSYSIYLVHFLFLIPFIKIAHQYKNIFISIALLLLFLMLNILSAYISYRFFEKPILDKRPFYK